MICKKRLQWGRTPQRREWVWSDVEGKGEALWTNSLQGRGRSTNVGWTHMASAEHEPITGVSGLRPQRGPGAPGQGVRRAKPPWSWKPFSFWTPYGSGKFASLSVFCKLPKPQVYVVHLSKKLKVLHSIIVTRSIVTCSNVIEINVRKRLASQASNLTNPLPPPPVKSHRICINLRNNLWQKRGGHVYPSPPHGDARDSLRRE